MKDFGPFADGFGFTVISNTTTISLVAPLLIPCCPPTIRRFVIPFVIFTVKRQTIGAYSHICQKVLKRVFPTSTNLNTATAIRFIAFTVGVITSAFHTRPRSPRWSANHAMCSIGTDCSFNVQTSATFRGVIFQIRSLDLCCISAEAPAQPYVLLISAPKKTDNGQPMEDLTGQINSAGAACEWNSSCGKLWPDHIFSLIPKNVIRLGREMHSLARAVFIVSSLTEAV